MNCFWEWIDCLAEFLIMQFLSISQPFNHYDPTFPHNPSYKYYPGIFETYLGTIFDIMGDFATQKGDRMSLESFQGFVTETEIFSAHDSNTLTAGNS